MFKKIKEWSGWETAGSIFMRRLEVLSGVLIAGAATLTSFNWLPYFSTGTVDWKLIAPIAGYLVVSGIVGEIVRRHKADDL